MKAIPGYEDYLINEDGTKVYSKKTQKYLTICKNVIHYKTRDYIQSYVHLYNEGKAKTCYISRLVYATFIGEIPDGMQVDHIDNDPENNHYSNLQLLTQSENLKKRYDDDPALRQKISEGMKGKHWSLTDITKQKMSEARSGKICVNNGMVSKFVFPNDIPIGFVKGRISRKKNK